MPRWGAVWGWYRHTTERGLELHLVFRGDVERGCLLMPLLPSEFEAIRGGETTLPQVAARSLLFVPCTACRN